MTVPPGTGDPGDQADLPTPLRFASVARLASRWPVATIRQAMDVSRSGYYAWNDRLRRLAATNPRRVASERSNVASLVAVSPVRFPIATSPGAAFETCGW